jgi:capsular polysaccharide transport system permease protein
MIKKRKPFEIFLAVIKALVLREVHTRFGTQKLGYFWAVVDPMVMIVVFSILRSYVHQNDTEVDYPVFLATSFIAFNMFKALALRSMDAFNANKGLFIYKQVKPFDTLVARAIIEISLTIIVTIIFLFIGWYMGFDIECKNILGVVFAYIWIAFFGLSLGVLFAVLGFFYENFKKIVRLVFMPLMFISGLFFSVEDLPQFARELVLYNPVVHFMELIHGEYFHSLDTVYVDYTYMLFWSLVPGCVGLWIYVKSERKIIMS